MEYSIIRVGADNYSLFDDMVFWRENGYERTHVEKPFSSALRNELTNPNMFVYAAKADNRFVGWISLILNLLTKTILGLKMTEFLIILLMIISPQTM